MSDLKDQNHIFPEPEESLTKNSYRPVLANDDTVLKNMQNSEKLIIQQANPNVSFKGVIKDISNTNIEALVRIKNENDEPEYKSQETIVTENVNNYNKNDQKPKKVIAFDPKLSFWKGKTGTFIKKFWWLITLFLILLTTLITFGVLNYLQNNKPVPIVKKVDINITGPDNAAKNSIKLWTVTITNNDIVNLNNLTLEMNYDRDFKVNKIFGDLLKFQDNDKLFKFDKLAIGEKKILNIEGKLDAQVDVNTEMSGKLRFAVDQIDQNKQTLQELVANKKVTKVDKSLIRIDITSDSRVPKESDQQVKVDFTNQSGKVLNNFRLKMTYPQVGTNFIYNSSEFFLPGRSKQTIPTVGDHTWNIPSLENAQTGTLIINTKMKGEANDKLIIIAELINSDDNILLNKADKEIVVVDKALTIKPSLTLGSDYIQPDGDMLYKITIKNNYNTELNNIKIQANFNDNADLIERDSLVADQGSPIINKSNKELLFTGAGLTSLQRMGPKAEVTVEFRVKVKSITSFTNSSYTQDNFYIQPKVTVTGDNFEPQSELGDIKRAKGGPDIDQKIEYIQDGNKKLAKVTWEVKNKFSNLKDVTLKTRTPLPPSAWNQNSITPPSNSNKITYSKDTGDIVWKIGDVKAYTGYNGQEVKVTFTITNETDSKINFTETPTFVAIDTLNDGFEFNQINNPIKDGGPVIFQQ
jgi:hypothetical protein